MKLTKGCSAMCSDISPVNTNLTLKPLSCHEQLQNRAVPTVTPTKASAHTIRAWSDSFTQRATPLIRNGACAVVTVMEESAAQV